MAIIWLALLIGGAISSPSAPRTENHGRDGASAAAYDYVVVGGGTAGLTLAARLSEDPGTTVAVVEAGTYYQITNPVLSSTPAGDVFWTGSSPSDVNPGVDWGFVTTPQAGANGRRLHYARGKCLGGSSGRNFMIYQRPDRGSLQQWADHVGDQSYTFDKMLPYFQKSVNFTAPGPTRFENATAGYNAAAFSAAGGPLHVSYPNYANPFSTFLPQAFAEVGIDVAQDFNSGSLFGAQYCSSTIDPYTAFRSSSQTSFLEVSQARPNLKVFYLTLAKKVLFDGRKTAKGVLLDSGLTLTARKEVILSAGAFQSPQLLMVSGIGPAATLRQLGIPVIADRPGVGQNLTDHVFFGPSYEVVVPTLGTVLGDPAALYGQIFTYFSLAQGPLTNPITDYLAWEKTPRSLLNNSTAELLSSRLPASWPEIEYLSSPGYVGNDSSLFEAPLGQNLASLIASLVAPLSRGNLTITSADAAVLPSVNPNWLTHPADAAVAVAAYKRMRAVFASKAMQGALAQPINEYFPGFSVQTDAQILDLVRNTAMTIYHAAVTCRMGRANDPNAVVDARAKVIGVKGLRVVDASSFALLPPGHPQSMVYALAEKIADDIRAGR